MSFLGFYRSGSQIWPLGSWARWVFWRSPEVVVVGVGIEGWLMPMAAPVLHLSGVPDLSLWYCALSVNFIRLESSLKSGGEGIVVQHTVLVAFWKPDLLGATQFLFKFLLSQWTTISRCFSPPIFFLMKYDYSGAICTGLQCPWSVPVSPQVKGLSGCSTSVGLLSDYPLRSRAGISFDAIFWVVWFLNPI